MQINAFDNPDFSNRITWYLNGKNVTSAMQGVFD
ncbi:hypothetical protein BXY51_009047 [Actinoplanes cyaneus]|nr:hypothetical protein [Actinoplanes cyaneus]